MNNKNINQVVIGGDEIPYSMIPNALLNDDELSLQAKGLMSIILSNKKGWVIYKSQIVKRSSNGKSATNSAWKELELKGYILGTEQRGSDGRFIGMNYVAYRVPFNGESEVEQHIQPQTDFPTTDNPITEKPLTDNQPLIILTSNNTNSNKNNTIPTYELFEAYALEKKEKIDRVALRFKYDAWVENGWKNGNDKKIKNWKSTLLNTLNYIPETKTKEEKWIAN